ARAATRPKSRARCCTTFIAQQRSRPERRGPPTSAAPPRRGARASVFFRRRRRKAGGVSVGARGGVQALERGRGPLGCAITQDLLEGEEDLVDAFAGRGAHRQEGVSRLLEGLARLLERRV